MISVIGSLITKPLFITPRKPNGHIWARTNNNALKPVRCVAVPSHKPVPFQQPEQKPSPLIQRRSGNYKPPIWGFEDIQSLNTEEFSGERYTLRISELKEEVQKMMMVDAAPVDQLELIDDLQRLGISYHFEDKIKKMLSRMYMDKYLKNDVAQEKDLYTEALAFRLFRQHGFLVSQDAFDNFKDEEGKFDSKLRNDTKGLVQLYEAAHTLTEGESSLEQAIEFTTFALQQQLHNLTDLSIHQNTAQQALELPLHWNWKAERPNTRSYVQAYETLPNMNPILLELAKLDFNILQSTYKQEIQHVSRWWENTGLIQQLPFARDRVVEAYFWAAGFLHEPQHGYYRIMISELINLIAVLDDMYDIYGTVEELEQFTRVIQRWDAESYEQLPEYMQIFWLKLNDFLDESAKYVLKNQGLNITHYLRKSWTDYAEVLMQEAVWYHGGHTPTMEEYTKTCWLSVSGPVVLTHAYFLVTKSIKEEDVESLYKYHDIVWSSSMIFRLMDDMGTSPEEMKRGDVPKWIQCHMNETGASEEEAREHLRCLIHETWKKMNRELEGHGVFDANFIRSATGLARMSHNVYQNGDGYGGRSVTDTISSMIFQPIL